MITILIVGYDPAHRTQLKATLEAAGYRVTTAPDAIHGLIAATRNPPDLILSDVLMQRMDGFTFLRVIKSRADLHRIPFLFGPSTVISEDERQFAQMLGAEAILASANDTGMLLATIAASLRRHTRAATAYAAVSEPVDGAAVLAIPTERQSARVPMRTLHTPEHI
jgi:DNA-binding response OmpR family regulator